MKLALLSAVALILFLLAALSCTSQQAYGGGQAWQRNECNKIVDDGERGRCLSQADSSYEDYKRQTQDDKKQ